MADATSKPKTAFGVVITSKAPAASAPPTSPRSTGKAPASPATTKAPAKAPGKPGPAVIKKAPAAKPPPTSGAQAEGQLSSSIGVGKIASKFGKQDFAPPPEKPLKPKPKVAAPAGESTAASKKLFEQKIKEQKPTPKLSLQAAKFERKINAQTRAVEASKTKAPLPQRPAASIAKQFQDGRGNNTGNTQKIAHSFSNAPSAAPAAAGVSTGVSTKDIASRLSAQAAASAQPVTSKPPVFQRTQEPEEQPQEEAAPVEEEVAPAAEEYQPQEETPQEEPAAEEGVAGEEQAGPETLPLHDANGNVVGSVTPDGSQFFNANGTLICTVAENVIHDGEGGQLGSIDENGHYLDSSNTDLGHMQGNQAVNGAGDLVGSFDGSKVYYSDETLFGTAEGVPVEAVAIFYFFFFAGGAQ